MMRKSSARPLASYLSPSSSVAPIHGPAARREVGGHGPAYLEPEEEGVRARPVTTSRPVHCRASKRTGRHGLSITSNPTLPVQPAGSQSAWSVRMVQGHCLKSATKDCIDQGWGRRLQECLLKSPCGTSIKTYTGVDGAHLKLRWLEFSRAFPDCPEACKSGGSFQFGGGSCSLTGRDDGAAIVGSSIGLCE